MKDTRCGPRGRIRAARLLIDGGAQNYNRAHHLHRLLGRDGNEFWTQDEGSRQAALARLRRALRSERNRGRSGHWSYDLNRHIGLLQALKAELATRGLASGHTRGSPQTRADAAVIPATPRTPPDMSETGTETS